MEPHYLFLELSLIKIETIKVFGFYDCLISVCLKKDFFNIGFFLSKYSVIIIELITVNLNTIKLLNSLFKEEVQQS